MSRYLLWRLLLLPATWGISAPPTSAWDRDTVACSSSAGLEAREQESADSHPDLPDFGNAVADVGDVGKGPGSAHRYGTYRKFRTNPFCRAHAKS